MYDLKQFILFNKQTKEPLSSVTDSGTWITYESALKLTNNNYGIGFVFTESDPYFFLDLDHCLQENGDWSELSKEMCRMFNGAYIEVSMSGTGLHIIGKGPLQPPRHSCRNSAYQIELYTSQRYVALTGTNSQGSPDADCSQLLPWLIDNYFPLKAHITGMDWTEDPCDEWSGYTDDTELIRAACKSGAAQSAFQDKLRFIDLWEANETALSVAFPPTNQSDLYNRSSADAALAVRLAFWTGNDCERIGRLMKLSGLNRSKWEREDYFRATILNSVALNSNVYQRTSKLTGAGSEEAEVIRERKLQTATPEERKLLLDNKEARKAKFWIDSANTPVSSLVQEIKSIYLNLDEQKQYFAGCVYIVTLHRIFTPLNGILKPEVFDSTFGGKIFLMDAEGRSTTRRAFTAVTQGSAYKIPVVNKVGFFPQRKYGEIIGDAINTYDPAKEGKRVPGDAQPFLDVVEAMLPDARDRQILLSYLAACIQYRGTKFQWAVLIQGTQGCGKGLISRCVQYALGVDSYVHNLEPSKIDNSFNGWMANNTLIVVDEIKVNRESQKIMERLKPMITEEYLTIESKGVDQVRGSTCANFLFMSNYKDAIIKEVNERRYCVFYAAQQSEEDKRRQGIDDSTGFFQDRWEWLRNGGFEIVADYLHTYPIPDKFNPATECRTAPNTTSTLEAIAQSKSPWEHHVLDLIEEDATGLRGGWASSSKLKDYLTFEFSRDRVTSQKVTRLLESMGYKRHPALNNGRTHNPTKTDGKKTFLFVKRDHPSLGLRTAAEVVNMYDEAQV